MAEESRKRRVWSWWYLLLLVQFPIALWVPYYDVAEPTLIGVPFFYWFQLFLVIVGAVLTAIVYFGTEAEEAKR